MRPSVVRCLRMRRFLPSIFQKSAAAPNSVAEGADDPSLSKQQQERLKGALEKLRIDEPRVRANEDEQNELEAFDSGDLLDDGGINMDSIRARGFLRYRYNYEPPKDLEQRFKDVISQEFSTEWGQLMKDEGDVRRIDLTKNIRLKFKLLDLIGRTFKHFIPNNELHRMRSVGDVMQFYAQPVSNITEYARMARESGKQGGYVRSFPGNLHVMEHPVRFHPQDKEAYHGGVTAYPGRGGQVLGLRNKRLYRQFQPKEEWFDYEDQSFDYNRVDKDMPWDPEISKRMDRYPTKKYHLSTKAFKRIATKKTESMSMADS